MSPPATAPPEGTKHGRPLHLPAHRLRLRRRGTSPGERAARSLPESPLFIVEYDIAGAPGDVLGIVYGPIA